jgi:hypothetical protein
VYSILHYKLFHCPEPSGEVNSYTHGGEISWFHWRILNASRSVARGGASDCNVPTIILGEPTRNSQNIKDQHADEPAKTCNTLQDPPVPFVEHTLKEKSSSFQKNIYVYGRYLCGVRESFNYLKC